MAIEVRIPTILRTYTDGAKSVEGSGDTLASLIADLEARYGGLQERLVDDSGLRRFVNVYLNDEDVRFLGGARRAGQGRRHRDGPARRRRRPPLTG